MIKTDTTEEDLIKQEEDAQKHEINRKRIALSHDERKLLCALTRKRTEFTFGQVHFCCKHSELVYEKHIDVCDLI